MLVDVNKTYTISMTYNGDPAEFIYDVETLGETSPTSATHGVQFSTPGEMISNVTMIQKYYVAINFRGVVVVYGNYQKSAMECYYQ